LWCRANDAAPRHVSRLARLAELMLGADVEETAITE
jgi:hypothetical protein